MAYDRTQRRRTLGRAQILFVFGIYLPPLRVIVVRAGKGVVYVSVGLIDMILMELKTPP